MVQKNAVRRIAEDCGCRVSKAADEMLGKVVTHLVKVGCERAKKNGRLTLMPQDLQVANGNQVVELLHELAGHEIVLAAKGTMREIADLRLPHGEPGKTYIAVIVEAK